MLRVTAEQNEVALSRHNVSKISKDGGDLIEVLGLRQKWKVRAKDTGFAFSVFEMELVPGQGIPLHTHPYPEFFYVLDGTLDFARLGSDGLLEWVRCRSGESVNAPINAPHGCTNRSDGLARFLSTSTYYHEAIFEEVGVAVTPDTPVHPINADAVQKFILVAAKYQGFNVEAMDSGRIVDA
jgi:quercetin dioxygenase-like cupin family protein